MEIKQPSSLVIETKTFNSDERKLNPKVAGAVLAGALVLAPSIAGAQEYAPEPVVALQEDSSSDDAQENAENEGSEDVYGTQEFTLQDAIDSVTTQPDGSIVYENPNTLETTHETIATKGVEIADAVQQTLGNEVTVNTPAVAETTSSNKPARVAVDGKYTVAAGDTLNAIAREFGVDANNMGYVGVDDKLPVDTVLDVSISSQNSVTLQKGDTLSALAKAHGVDQSELMQLNSITDANKIYAGKTFILSSGFVPYGQKASTVEETPSVQPVEVPENVLQLEEPAAEEPTPVETPVPIPEDTRLPMQSITVPAGLTIGELSEELIETVPTYTNNYDTAEALEADIVHSLALAGIDDPADMQAGQSLDIGHVTPEVAEQAQQAADEVVAPAVAQSVVVEPQIVVAEAFSQESPGGGVETLELMTPPNLGGPNEEGYYLFPEPIEGFYKFYENTPLRSRCGALENVLATYTVAYHWYQDHPENMLRVGDLTEADGHASHNNGADGDIVVVDRIAANINGDSQLSFELAVLYARTGAVKNILFNDPHTIELFNNWAIDNDLDVRMIWWANHDDHFHVNFLPEFEGQWSGKCAPEIQNSAPVVVESSDPIIEADLSESKSVELSMEQLAIIDGFDNLSEQKKDFLQETLIAARSIKQNGAEISVEGLVAQAILETSWGTSTLAVEASNYFGITGSYNGNSTNRMDKDESGNPVPHDFKVYPTVEAGLEDYADLIARLDWYDDAQRFKDDWQNYILGLQYKLGENGQIIGSLGEEPRWAEDKKYSDKLISIANSYRLDELAK